MNQTEGKPQHLNVSRYRRAVLSSGAHTMTPENRKRLKLIEMTTVDKKLESFC